MVKLGGMIGVRIYSLLLASLICTTIAGQAVKIGTINIYGNRSISTDSIVRYAQVSEGDSISQKTFLTGVIEKNLTKIPGIKQAKTALICCDKNGDYHLFIGVAESELNILSHRARPTLRIVLPEKYLNAYLQFSDRLSDAIQKSEADEDWNNGHSLIRYLPARRIQEKYMLWADENFSDLKKILRTSAYDQQRAAAAQIIAYHFDKNEVVPELIYALIDESDEVRNNAIKALAIIANYAGKHPEKKIQIPDAPFIRMINSVAWQDRNKGLAVLTQLTATRDTALLNRLKETSLPALKEMALWKSAQHAFPAYMILARVAGVPEEKINSYGAGTNFADEAMKLAGSIK